MSKENNKTTIQRVPHKRDFFCMDRNSAQDNSLSWQATGLLSYLLSLPSNWTIYKTELYQNKTNGREATSKAFNELVKQKYIYKLDYKKKNLKRTKYFLFEKPYKQNDLTLLLSAYGFSEAEDRIPEEPQLHNTQELSTYKKIDIKKEESKPKKTEHSSLASEEAHESIEFSNEIEEVVNLLHTSILSQRANFKITDRDFNNWALEIDRMIRLDSRDSSEMAEVLQWLPSNDFWRDKILSAGKFRKQYDKLCIERDKTKNDKSKYKNFAYKIKKCMQIKSLKVSDKGIYDPYNYNFELSYAMPYEEFCRCLATKYEVSDYEGDM